MKRFEPSHYVSVGKLFNTCKDEVLSDQPDCGMRDFFAKITTAQHLRSNSITKHVKKHLADRIAGRS